MKRAGLSSLLDDGGMVFRFYRFHALQFSTAVDDSGLYKLDWEPVLAQCPPTPRFSCKSVEKGGGGGTGSGGDSAMV